MADESFTAPRAASEGRLLRRHRSWRPRQRFSCSANSSHWGSLVGRALSGHRVRSVAKAVEQSVAELAISCVLHAITSKSFFPRTAAEHASVGPSIYLNRLKAGRE